MLDKTASSGNGAFLAVLKLLGAANGNPLSFPLEGYTLALDFKITPIVFDLLAELDRIVMDYGGRLYLAKDVRMRRACFRRGYPQWKTFAALRKKLKLKPKFNSMLSKRLDI